MINITFPDGSVKEFEKGVTGKDIAESISEGLLRNSVAIKINDMVKDIHTSIDNDASVEIITANDDAGLDIYRHSSAHIMALAIKRLFPDVKLAIGPSIEDGFYYDFDDVTIQNEDFEKITSEMKKIIKEKIPFSKHVISKNEAMGVFKEEPYKLELIQDLDEREEISYYKLGDLVDLCRGPHIPHSGKIKAFKLLRLAGAYWRGDSNNKMLTRLYATSFPKKEQLAQYLEMRRLAEERDHVKLGRELDLFITDKTIGQGLPLLTPKGTVIMQVLRRFIEDEETKRGYKYTITPYMAKNDLFKISGHWDHYKDGMFIIGDEKGDEVLALRPMTCPFQFTLYNRKKHSYKELPIKYAETSMLFRNESSGEMHGLTRIRQFTLAEGHIVCRHDQLEHEFKEVLKLIDWVLKTLDLNEYTFRFSKWDPDNKEKYIDNPSAWEASQKTLKNILDNTDIDYVEAEGEAAFYGPKLDIQMKNVWGKEDTIITVQIDFALPDRFKMKYIDAGGDEKTPMIIHRSSIGCYERTIALLIERYAGKFPFWLAPEQVRILTIKDLVADYAVELKEILIDKGVRVETDERSETLGKKIRDAQLDYVPCILTIGEKEMNERTISLRTLSGDVMQGLSIDKFVELCNKLERERLVEIPPLS